MCKTSKELLEINSWKSPIKTDNKMKDVTILIAYEFPQDFKQYLAVQILSATAQNSPSLPQIFINMVSLIYCNE